MRMHYLFLVAVMVASIDFAFATANFAHTKHSTATRTESTRTVRVLDGALNESNGKRFLRTSKTIDEDDGEEERGIPVITYYTDEITASGVRKFLRNHDVISKGTSNQLKKAGWSNEELASMFSKYIAVVKRPSS
ncbi:hypothetical protein PHMEG_0006711 [Phytophthora megakarya]|uniref:RxLR effector protein n=1 Tax=Phytophthora megakarya TaxID=4795 RepID=A0A225WPP7_9STRA|nr:hypothetical protein PHMEG_0006711 [Phytophthora megakarya]